MRQQRKPKRDPIFMGMPSPSLAVLNKLTVEGLNLRIKRFTDEIERIGQKVERLRKMQPPAEEKIAKLLKLQDRLNALCKTARERLAERSLRQEQAPLQPTAQPSLPPMTGYRRTINPRTLPPRPRLDR